MPDAAPFVPALLNFGGMGLLAGVLFYLHITSQKASEKRLDDLTKTFLAELKEERRICHDDHEKLNLSILRNHDAILSLSNVCRAFPWSYQGGNDKK